MTAELFGTLAVDVDDLPIDHTDDYYRMKMLRTADGTTVFSSSGIDQDGWTEVPDDTVTRVDLRTLAFSQRSVLAPGTGAAVADDERRGGRPPAAITDGGAGSAPSAPVDLAERRARRAG